MRLNSSSSFAIPAAVLALTLILAPAATPDVWNKQTNVKFGEPVEFPGGVVVPAGGYVMKLMDSLSNRHIVQVLNENQNQVYATVFAIPTQRSEPAEKTIITFYETPRGEPLFVHKWFYPGDSMGQEFPYPRGRTRHIARATTFSGMATDTERESPGAIEETPEAASSSVNAESSAAPETTEQQPVTEPDPMGQTKPSPDPQATPKTDTQATPKPGQMPADQSKPAATGEQKPEAGEQLPATASIAPEIALTGGLLVLMALVLMVARRAALRTGADTRQRQ